MGERENGRTGSSGKGKNRGTEERGNGRTGEREKGEREKGERENRETGKRRNGETEKRRNWETEKRRNGETEKRRSGGTGERGNGGASVAVNRVSRGTKESLLLLSLIGESGKILMRQHKSSNFSLPPPVMNNYADRRGEGERNTTRCRFKQRTWNHD